MAYTFEDFIKAADYIDANYPKLFNTAKSFIFQEAGKNYHVDPFELCLRFEPSIIERANFEAIKYVTDFTLMFAYGAEAKNIDHFNYVRDFVESEKDNMSLEPRPHASNHTSYIDSYHDDIFYDGYKDILSPKDENAINVFLRKEKNSLFSIYDDFDMKTDCLYRTILQGKQLPSYIKKLSQDYINLISCIYNNKYIIDGREISLSEAAEYDRNNPIYAGEDGDGSYKGIYFGQLDRSNASSSFKGIFVKTISSAVVLIYYNYWRMTEDPTIFSRLMNLILTRTTLIKKDNNLLEDSEPNSINEILQLLGLDKLNNLSDEDKLSAVLKMLDEMLAEADNQEKESKHNIYESLKNMPAEISSDILKTINLNEPVVLNCYVKELGSSGIRPHVALTETNKLNGLIKTDFSASDFCTGLLTYLTYDGEGRDETIGISNNKFISNNSFVEYLDAIKEKPVIGEKGLLNNLDSNMDFTPYTLIVKKQTYIEEITDQYDSIGLKLGSLVLCAEQLMFLNNIINKMNHGFEDFDLNSYINRLVQRTYGKSHVRGFKNLYSNVSIENLELEETKEKVELSQKATYLINDLVESFNDYSQLNDIILQSKVLVDDMVMFGVEDDFITVSSEITNRISKKIVELYEKNENLSDVAEKARGRFAVVKEAIKEKIGFKDVDFDSEMKSIENLLASAEVFYDSFVNNPYSDKDLDYSGIALNYYKAMEQLVNYVVYKPYYTQYLKDRQLTSEADEEGYAGESYYKISHKYDGIYQYKPYLEYGICARLFSNVSNTAKFNKIFKYFVDNNIDILKANAYFQLMKETSYSRNTCVHSLNTNLDSLKTARSFVFGNEGESDNDQAETISSLIFKLPSIFAK